jgi:putative ABC transport system ATP-binding protein
MTIMPEPLISLRSVEKSYPLAGGRTWVLRRIQLDIQPGEFVTLMGPSGAGKSTLLSILGMLDAEWQGEYFLDAQPVHAMAVKARAELSKRTIGFVFQQYHLLDSLTVAENLEVPLSYRDLKRSEREALVGDMLDRFQLVGKKDLYPNQLSGGQQQVVGIARALIASPKVLLADEPTGNLHSAQAKQIMEMFQALNRAGTTVVQVTHSEANAAYGHRVVQLADGWIQTT